MAENEKSNLEKAGSFKNNKVRDIKPLSKSRGQRQRETSKPGQVVVKVASYAGGSKRVGASLKYVSREGDLTMEDENGLTVHGAEEIQEVLDDWSTDFGQQKKTNTGRNQRDTMHLVLSTPAGTDRTAAQRAIKDFAAEQFSGNHQYLIAVHDDTENPHAHVIVKTKGFDGKHLRTNKKTLQEWRTNFAEKAIDHNINVDASSRLSRGVGTRGRTLKMIKAAEGAVKKGVEFMADTKFKDELKAGLKEYSETGKLTLKPWEIKAKQITETERGGFKQEAKQILADSKNVRSPEEKAALEKQALGMMQYAKSIPEPQSKREQVLNQLIERVNSTEINKGRGNDVER